MKRIIGLGIVAALLVALPLAHQAMAAKKADPHSGQMLICHFSGHVADVSLDRDDGEFIGDFVPTGDGSGCIDREGNLIWVSEKAACNGHGVFNYNCE